MQGCIPGAQLQPRGCLGGFLQRSTPREIQAADHTIEVLGHARGHHQSPLYHLLNESTPAFGPQLRSSVVARIPTTFDQSDAYGLESIVGVNLTIFDLETRTMWI